MNINGQIGCNIPCDLHIEHLNCVCKDALKGVGANKSIVTIQRVGKVVGALTEVTKNFDNNVMSTMVHTR